MRLCKMAVALGAVIGLSMVSIAAEGSDLRLIEAVKDQDQHSVRDLLDQYVDVNAREGDGATALHWAVVRNDAA